ncbi:MAG TPA: nucleoside hydrolase [Candidatus Binataceae bacterium]
MKVSTSFATMMLGAALLVQSAFAQRTPIILDTDIGGDIDDAFALALVLASPELDLKAVTTVSGDTMARARIAAKMLSVAGRNEVPVAAGDPGKPSDIDQAPWAAGFTCSSLQKETAVELMSSVLARGHGQTVLVAVGPLTNLAALLRQHPESKRLIKRIVLMGGSIARGYYPNSGPTSEYNIAADAAASQAVFSSGIPITMAPLDVTARLQLEGARLDKVFAAPSPMSRALHELYLLWKQPVPTMHDPMAVSMLIDPSLSSTRMLSVQIGADGMTRSVPAGVPNALVGVEIEPAKFLDFYVKRVAP